MLTSYKYEMKNKEELENKIKNELNVSFDDIYMFEEETTTGLFKNKKIKIEIVKKEDVIKHCEEFFKELSKLMKIKINHEINFKDETLKIILVSEHNNVLIGKDGKTLNSLMLILKHYLESSKYKIYLDLDVQNYKHKKLKRLEKDIKNICKEVLIMKNEVKLDPMNSYDRRIVHNIVSKFDNLTSISCGENEERYTIIKFVD